MHYLFDPFSKDIYGLTFLTLPSCLNPNVSAYCIVNKRVFVYKHKSCKNTLALSTTKEYKYTTSSILNTSYYSHGKILSKILYLHHVSILYYYRISPGVDTNSKIWVLKSPFNNISKIPFSFIS